MRSSAMPLGPRLYPNKLIFMQTIHTKLWAASVGLVLCSGFVQAEDNPSVDRIVVTATRMQLPASNITQTVEIITRDDIDRVHAASATEVLRQIPGTNVIQQGGRGGTSSLLLRGGEPNFTVVLIDGIQVNDPTNTRGGSYDIGNLEQSQLQNVEVSFGPLSPVYGSDALSGVVNFETRGADSGSVDSTDPRWRRNNQVCRRAAACRGKHRHTWRFTRL
jgi:outer membrane cobalamin receptor